MVTTRMCIAPQTLHLQFGQQAGKSHAHGMIDESAKPSSTEVKIVTESHSILALSPALSQLFNVAC